MSRTTKTLASLAFILAALGIVGHYDYEDSVAQDQHYCDMVREGAWPNFKPEVNCK